MGFLPFIKVSNVVHWKVKNVGDEGGMRVYI